MSQRSKWSLIGIPDHQGVVHVGGRIGSARGPSVFRTCFARLKGRDPVQSTLHECGDVRPISTDIESNHNSAADLICNGHRASGLSVVVGGGHDHGYSHLLGIHRALEHELTKKLGDHAHPEKIKLGCINIDAHLDVRKPSPWVTSGSPFYLAIESKILSPKNFLEFGIQSHCNQSDLWAYVESHKIKVVPFEDLRHGKAITQFKAALKKLSASCDAIVISLDLDAVSESFAPGVSAPQAEGFSSTDILEMMEYAGEDPQVVSLGVFELNPEHDIDHRTARLAATAVYHFVARALRR